MSLVVLRKEKKMKWITPLWRDPIGWSDWVAKTKLRVLVWTLTGKL